MSHILSSLKYVHQRMMSLECTGSRYTVDKELIVAERFEFNNLDFKEITISKRR